MAATNEIPQKLVEPVPGISSRMSKVGVDGNSSKGPAKAATPRRIRSLLEERLANFEHPGQIGSPLRSEERLWRYGVADYRIIAEIQDDALVVLVVELGHRREIYRR